MEVPELEAEPPVGVGVLAAKPPVGAGVLATKPLVGAGVLEMTGEGGEDMLVLVVFDKLLFKTFEF